MKASLIALGSVLSLAVVALMPPTGQLTKNQDKELEVLLCSYHKALQEPPTDNKFGTSRLQPNSFLGHKTLRATYLQSLNAFKDEAFVVGIVEQTSLSKNANRYIVHRPGTYGGVKSLNTAEFNFAPRSALSMKSGSKLILTNFEYISRVTLESLKQSEKGIVRKDVEFTGVTVGEPTKKTKLKGTVLMRNVYANSKSCLSCHKQASNSVPIASLGVVAIANR